MPSDTHIILSLSFISLNSVCTISHWVTTCNLRLCTTHISISLCFVTIIFLTIMFLNAIHRTICFGLIKTIFRFFSGVVHLGFSPVCFSVPLLRIPRAPIITWTAVVLNVHIFWISMSNSLYLQSLSNSLWEIFVSVGALISIRKQVSYFLL